MEGNAGYHVQLAEGVDSLSSDLQIPKILLHLDLSPGAIVLYMVLLEECLRVYKTGYKNTQQLASACHVCKDTITKAKKELVEAGLINIHTYKGQHHKVDVTGHKYKFVEAGGHQITLNPIPNVVKVHCSWAYAPDMGAS